MTDILDFADDLSNVSTEDLRALLQKINKEMEIRKQYRKTQAIENFRTAFVELLKAGVDVYVSDGEYRIGFVSWDWFEFD